MKHDGDRPRTAPLPLTLPPLTCFLPTLQPFMLYIKTLTGNTLQYETNKHETIDMREFHHATSRAAVVWRSACRMSVTLSADLALHHFHTTQ